MNMSNTFEIIGYNIDYYLRGKYVGTMKRMTPDRETMGYTGRKTTIADKDIMLKKRMYKKGTEFTTECIPLCGKYLGTQEEKINAMLNSRVGYEKI